MLECEPLSRWEPNDLSESLLVRDFVEGTQVTESGPPSYWVSQLMKIFCKMVGFPIVKHEAQCLTLFCILEQECLKVNDDEVSKQPANSESRGFRSLRGLFLMLIMMVSLLGVGAELLLLIWGLLVVLNDSTTIFLECKGA